MKHIFTLMALVAGLNSVVTAQISITASDMPTVGEAYVFVTGDSIWGAGIDVSAGTNKTWDFSNAVPSTFNQETEEWVSVSSSVFGSDFPLATIAASTESGDSTDALFFTIDDTGFYQIGNGSLDGNGYTTPGVQLAALPMTYNTTFGSSSDIETTLDGLPITGTAVCSAVVDGWGTIKTPLGTFQALRVKRDVNFTISLFGIPVTATDANVEFWAKDYGRPVFSYTTTTSNVLGEISVSSFATWISEAIVSTKAPAPTVQQFSMAPNPATDRTYIDVATKGAHQVKVCIFSTTGQLMSTTNVNARNDVQQISVDIAAFPTGTYTVVLLGSNGKVWGSQQLVKQ